MSIIATVGRKAHFNAAHRLHNPNWSDEKNLEVFGSCNNPYYHGHNYDLEVLIKGPIQEGTGYIIDTKILKQIIKEEVEDSFDHKNLNEETEEFKNLNPTCENIAYVIYNKIRTRLADGLELKIVLYETQRNFVQFGDF